MKVRNFWNCFEPACKHTDRAFSVSSASEASRPCGFGTRGGGAHWVCPLSEENGQQHTHTQREKPQRRRWSSHKADAAKFGRGGARIEEQFLSVAAFEKQKYERRRSAINQVRHQRGKQCGRCARAPVNLASEQQRQEGHRSEIPPDDSNQPSPHRAEPDARGFASKQHTKCHADQCAHQEMEKQRAKNGQRSVKASNFGQYTCSDHHRARNKSPGETAKRSPPKRMQH